jgi:hypothetical protein
MDRGTFRARAATAALLLALAGCGSGAAATPTPTPIFGTSIPNPTASPSGNPTGQHWTGTEHMVLLILAGCSITVDATLDVVVGTGGQVSGTATGSFDYLRTGCGGSSLIQPQSLPITGMLSSTQFHVTIPLGAFGTQLPVTVILTSPTSAHANATDHPGAAQRTYIIDLTCDRC